MSFLPTSTWRHLLAASALIASLGLAACQRSSGGGSTRSNAVAQLRVESTSPVGGATGVAPDAPIDVTFSSEVEASTLHAGSFIVEGSASGRAAGTYSYDPVTRTARFTPSARRQVLEQVKVRLTGSIHSTANASLRPVEFVFQVEDATAVPDPGPEPLTVISSQPAAYTAGVGLEDSVSLFFGEAIDPDTVGADAMWLTSAGSRVPATVALVSGVELRATPLEPFAPGQEVVAHVGSAIRGAEEETFSGHAFQFRARAAAPPTARGKDVVFSTLRPVRWLKSADLDLDGKADLAYAMENETVVDLQLSRGDGNFSLALRIDTTSRVTALALADLDADGDVDVLVGTQDRVASYTNLARSSYAAPNELHFEVGPMVPAGSAVRALAVEDLDHDGVPDVVADTDAGLWTRLGGLDHPISQTLGTARLARSDLVLADLNLDGHLDLTFASRQADQVTIYWSRGTGPELFVAPRNITLGVPADQVAAVDLEGDPRPELLVLAALSASSSGGAFRILTQGDAGAWQVTQPAPDTAPDGAGGGVEDVLDAGRFELADLDGDGALDVMLAAAAPGKVYLYLNEAGIPNFQEPRTLLAAPGALLPVAADITGDGSLEVIAGAEREIHALLPVAAPVPPVGGDHYLLKVEDAQVRQKDANAAALVRLTNTKPLQGYSVVLGYDAEAITPRSVSIEGTASGAAPVEFTEYLEHAEQHAVSFSAIVEFLEPFENHVIPAGENQLLFRLQFDVPETAPLGGTQVAILSEAQDPPVATAVVVDAQSTLAELQAGTVTVLPPKETPPPPSDNKFRFEDVHVPLDGDGVLTVLGSNVEKAEAFTAIFAYDPSVLEVTSVDLDGTISGPLEPDIFIPNIDAEHGTVTTTVLFDILPPIDDRAIPPGTDQLLLNARLRPVPGAAAGSSPVEFRNEVGSPPLNNIFVMAGASVFPELVGGLVFLEDSTSEAQFIRGDVNSSLKVDLGDAVALLDHLFRGVSQVACLDAGDTDDSGRLDIGDAIGLLNHLFLGGAAPAAPYPELGVDPTPDDLGCSTPPVNP